MRNTKDIDFRKFLFRKKKKKQLAFLQFYIFIMKIVLKVFQNSSCKDQKIWQPKPT